MAWDIGAFEYETTTPVAVDDNYDVTDGTLKEVDAVDGVLSNDTYTE